MTTVKGDFLKTLANAGDGQFYFAIFNGDHLKKLTSDISLLEKTQFQTSMNTQYDEMFGYPLAMGILLIFSSFFMNDDKSRAEEWKGRYESPS